MRWGATMNSMVQITAFLIGISLFGFTILARARAKCAEAAFRKREMNDETGANVRLPASRQFERQVLAWPEQMPHGDLARRDGVSLKSGMTVAGRSDEGRRIDLPPYLRKVAK